MKLRKGGKLSGCLETLKLLGTYCQELLKTDAKISQGEDVIQFFEAQTQDLDPSFPENRYEIKGVIWFIDAFMKQKRYRIRTGRRETAVTPQGSPQGCSTQRFTAPF